MLLLGEQKDGKREGPKESRRERMTGERSGGGHGPRSSSQRHFSLFPRPPRVSRNEMGDVPLWVYDSSTHTVSRHTPIILYTSVRARVPARDGEGYTPRCYPLGHSISRVRDTRVVTLNVVPRCVASRRVAAPRRVPRSDAPLPVNRVFTPSQVGETVVIPR